MQYRKKPVVVEAVQWRGDNRKELEDFTRKNLAVNRDSKRFAIATLEGIMEASPGDYIIKGVNGEFYPCKPDIFAKTYEPVY